MSRKWNLVENIEEFLRDERVRLSEREEMVPAAAPEKKKRAPAKSSEAKVDSLSADNPRLQELLETCSTATSDFVRSLDGIQRLAADISKESESITKGDAEYGVRRSDKLQKMISEFSDYVGESYSNFAAGREAMKAIASMSGFSTTRKAAVSGAAAPKKEPTNYAAMDATKLVSDIGWMSKKLNTLLLDTAKSGAATKKMALDIAKSKASGDALLSEIKDFVEAYLDFRDLTSGALFGLIKGFSNRLNELVMRVSQSKAGSGIMKVRAESVYQIDLSYLAEDRDFAWIAEDLHFAKAPRNQIAESKKGNGVIKVHPKDKQIVEGMCRSMVSEMNNATSSMLDEAGCAYAAMESLYEMYGEPDASYYADEQPYVGVQESRRVGTVQLRVNASITGMGDITLILSDSSAKPSISSDSVKSLEKFVKKELGASTDANKIFNKKIVGDSVHLEASANSLEDDNWGDFDWGTLRNFAKSSGWDWKVTGSDADQFYGLSENRSLFSKGAFGRNIRLSEAADSGKSAAAKLRDMASKFEKKVKYEKDYGMDAADEEQFENWTDTIQFIRDLAKAVESGSKKDVAALYDRSGYLLSYRNGIETWNGFEDAKNEIRKLTKIK